MTTAERERQRFNALDLANQVRMSNGRLRRELGTLTPRQGRLKAAELLLEPSGPVGSLPVGRMLLSINRVGETAMATLLREAGIFSTTKRVGALTPRQRTALANLLRIPV